jgi:hypothetical protein
MLSRMICAACGNRLDETDKFCGMCGIELTDTTKILSQHVAINQDTPISQSDAASQNSRQPIEYFVFLTKYGEVVFIVQANSIYRDRPLIDIKDDVNLLEISKDGMTLFIEDMDEDMRAAIFKDEGFTLHETDEEGVLIAKHRFGRPRE